MRNPDRLNKFYEELQKIHSSNFPDMDFLKFILAFLDQYARDPFFPEEDEILMSIREYADGRKAEDWDGNLKYDPATYDKMRDIHMKAFPDWRFGQLLINFLGCVTCTRTQLTEANFVKYLEQFAHGERPHD